MRVRCPACNLISPVKDWAFSAGRAYCPECSLPLNDELCACGETLHYLDAGQRAKVEKLVSELGPVIKVTASGRSWWVPRHYIALHGLKAVELPTLATHLGFQRA